MDLIVANLAVTNWVNRFVDLLHPFATFVPRGVPKRLVNRVATDCIGTGVRCILLLALEHCSVLPAIPFDYKRATVTCGHVLAGGIPPSEAPIGQ